MFVQLNWTPLYVLPCSSGEPLKLMWIIFNVCASVNMQLLYTSAGSCFKKQQLRNGFYIKITYDIQSKSKPCEGSRKASILVISVKPHTNQETHFTLKWSDKRNTLCWIVLWWWQVSDTNVKIFHVITINYCLLMFIFLSIICILLI